jgi:phosphoenolpyruvate-protein phosphotransferase
MRKGVPVSPGIAVAKAYCIDEVFARRETYKADDVALSQEVVRFDKACAAAVQELDTIIARVTRQLGEEEAAIFRSHRLLVRDPALVGKVKSAILNRHLDARAALQEALDEYQTLFSQIQDDYLKERMADVRDVVTRIVGHLAVESVSQNLDVDEPVIVVAMEILPSQAMTFDKRRVAGIVTEKGAATGHAAILARSLGIPAVSGLSGITREIRTGDLVAIDGREGHVYLNPGPEVESAYRKLEREFVDMRDRLIENRDQEPISADGVRVELLANVNGPKDAVMAVHAGASGVGLYRTEFLFLTHPTVPDEEEQLAAYRAVIEASPNRTVTVRTLDLGGDKQVPYLGTQREANPFMGWRGIRLSSSHPEFFRTQLRAIFRAGVFGKVSLLFPMISTLEEVQLLKRVVHRTRLELANAGVAFDEKMPLGIMVEVPSAALCIEYLLDEVDFISIGSNDLIQYIMAADRDNPKVAHLCEPFSPALMKVLSQVIQACQAGGKPVTLCGEMAGRPRCFLPLFGMGLRRLSMSPAFVPPLKEMVRRTTLDVAQKITRQVLQMKTQGEIRSYLTRKTRQICPNVAFLDTRK